LDYLHERGFTDETIRKAGLGFNPKRWDRPGPSWGLPDRRIITLHGPGIVIPWQDEAETLWRVNVRLLNPIVTKDGKELRYIEVASGGGHEGLYNVTALRPGRPVIIVEGELDCLAVQQAVGDLAGVVSLGSTKRARRQRWLARLALCEPVLVALDADADGEGSSTWWIDRLSASTTATRWRPWLKDPGEMLKAGMDLRQWVSLGLATTTVGTQPSDSTPPPITEPEPVEVGEAPRRDSLHGKTTEQILAGIYTVKNLTTWIERGQRQPGYARPEQVERWRQILNELQRE